jgi:spore photoproduct lyase
MPFVKQLTLVEPESIHRRNYGNGILRRFEKTPSSIVCPHFWQLNWGYGCPFNCAYCYLQGTFYGRKTAWHRKTSQVFYALDNAFDDGRIGLLEPTVFNSGELTDSLAFPKIMEKITDKFEEQDIHKILLLTKSDNVGFLVRKPRSQTIYSFSLNAEEVARRWEQGTAGPKSRIKAAAKVSNAGYEVRVRIDPIFPINNWEEHYEDIIYLLFSMLDRDPDRITLGTPRGLQKTLRFSKDASWTKYFSESSSWGKKIAFDLRKEIYEYFSDKLRSLGYNKSRIAICKETTAMWSSLGWDKDKCKCNCIL